MATAPANTIDLVAKDLDVKRVAERKRYEEMIRAHSLFQDIDDTKAEQTLIAQHHKPLPDNFLTLSSDERDHLEIKDRVILHPNQRGEFTISCHHGIEGLEVEHATIYIIITDNPRNSGFQIERHNGEMLGIVQTVDAFIKPVTTHVSSPYTFRELLARKQAKALKAAAAQASAGAAGAIATDVAGSDAAGSVARIAAAGAAGAAAAPVRFSSQHNSKTDIPSPFTYDVTETDAYSKFERHIVSQSCFDRENKSLSDQTIVEAGLRRIEGAGACIWVKTNHSTKDSSYCITVKAHEQFISGRLLISSAGIQAVVPMESSRALAPKQTIDEVIDAIRKHMLNIKPEAGCRGPEGQ